MLIIFNIIRFIFSSENVPCRGRHSVFFHEGGGVGDQNREESWLCFFECMFVAVVYLIISGAVMYACRL